MARRSDGSVVAWGDNGYGQCNVPALPLGLTYVEVAAGGGAFTLARRSDGNVMAWGLNFYGQCNVPALPPGLTYVEVVAGWHHTVARRSDGSVLAWGRNQYGQCNVPALPPGLTYVEIAATDTYTVARRSDGSVVEWGSFLGVQPALPPGLTYVEVTAGFNHTMARRSDGSVVEWGSTLGGQPALPPGITGSRISAGRVLSAAIIQSGGFHTFAAGCPGSAGVTRLDAAPPRVGTTTNIALQTLPQNVAVLVLGFSNVTSAFGPLPLDLTSFGMPGCLAHVSLDCSALVPGAGGIATSALTVPALPALAGMIAHGQAIVFDPSAANPAGLVMSDAITFVIGP